MASKSKQPTTAAVERPAEAAERPPQRPNTVQAARPSARKPTKRERKASATQENSIRADSARSKAPPELDQRSRTQREQNVRADPDSHAVPDHIKERYIQVGNKYHFPNGDPAFR